MSFVLAALEQKHYGQQPHYQQHKEDRHYHVAKRLWFSRLFIAVLD